MARKRQPEELSHSEKAWWYVEAVLENRQPACEFVRLACERHRRDWERRGTRDFPWTYSEERAHHVCEFLEKLPHVQGRDWPSKSLILQPWQCFQTCSLFGWVAKREPHYRRFRRAYLEEPRKNAKTTTAAGYGLYLFAADGEDGAEVYTAAVTRDQAKHTWKYAATMAERRPSLRGRYGVRCYTHHLEIPHSGSIFRPLSREADTLEGLNVHGGIIDELHAHKTRAVFDVLDSATGARRQPLLINITTAGDETSNVCAEQRDYLVDILRGVHKDDTFFGLIYTVDVGDDWTTDEAIRKANPNLDVSVFFPDVDGQRKKALRQPQAQSEYKRKRLCIWGGAADAYFNVLAWQTCRKPISLDEMEGRECFFALDLSSKTDLAALMLLFRHEGRYTVFGQYYLPEAALEPDSPNHERYRGWQLLDNFTFTDGSLIDYDVIEDDLQALAKRFRPREIAFDPWNATQLATRMLKAGLPMVQVPQTTKQLSEPMKTLAGLITERRIEHDGDPVLTWAIENTNAKEDHNENVFPRKAKPEKKIDPAVALIMDLSRAFAVPVRRQPYCISHGPIILDA